MNTSSNQPPPAAPDPLAVALSQLDPAPHGFEWNKLMFAAGRASKKRAIIFWRVVSGVCALAAVGFAFAYFTQAQRVTERIVYVERPAPKVETPEGPQPDPQPLPLPVPPKPQPEPSSVVPGSDWTFEPPPEQGAATRWFTQRNEVLTIGLSVLPDPGRKVAPPRGEK